MRHAVRRASPVDPPPPLTHLAALDGVRGLAVGAVLAFHAGHLSGGFLGVDLFFTLSGFLITRLILDELARDRFTLKAFWARRARRLLPAAWLLIGAVLLAGPVLVRSTELGTLRGDAVATLGYGANWWRVASSSSYFAIFTTPSPLQHTWSLAIEEQLYVVWPLLLLLLWRVGRHSIGVLAAATTALTISSVAAGALLYSTADEGNRAYYGTDTRAASVLIGALAAMAVWRFGPALARLRGAEPLGVVALCAIVGAWALGDNGAWLYRGGFATLAVAGAFLLTVVTTRPDGRLHSALAWRPLTSVGVISYGLYLYHWPIFVWLSPERGGLGEWPLLALRLTATFTAATLSYFLVERPYRRRQWTLSLRTVGAAAAFGLILVAAVMLPAPKRLNSEQAAAAVAAIDQTSRAPSSAVAPPATTTTLAPLPPPARLLVFGDSVAFKLKQGFADQGPPGVIVRDLGVIACGLGDEWPKLRIGETISNDPCTDWRTLWPSKAKALGADGTLLVFGSESSTRLIEGTWREACDPVYDAWHQQVFTDALTLMTQTGPVWLALAPYNRFVVDRDGVLEERDAHSDCTNRSYRAAAAAAGPNVRLVDLAHFVCPTGNDCADEIDGVKLRPDGLHFDGPGGDIAARWLLTQLGVLR
jgi:peptidoglycan/LPS O-acetylase OafA/YrhL